MYEKLKKSVTDVIKENGNGEITGPMLQGVLLSLVNSLGNGSLLKGIATTSTKPGEPDGAEAYLYAGTSPLPNFSNFKPTSGGLYLLTWDGSKWVGEDLYSISTSTGIVGDGSTSNPLKLDANNTAVISDGVGIIGNGTNTDKLRLNEDIYVQTYAYGVRHNTKASSPTLTRIGNMDLHKSLPVQSQMRRCILADTGEVAYYLDPLDSSKKEDGTDSDLSGADGQFMVEIPEHFRRINRHGNYMDVLISVYQLAGFERIDKHYVGVTKSVVDRTEDKLCSVINSDPRFRGGGNQADWDALPKSMLGMAATNLSLTAYREKAKKRGDGWCVRHYKSVEAVYWLFVTEYATLNSQLDFTTELTSEGFRKGGLGVGVTTAVSATWSNFNGYYPLVKEGVTAKLGNVTGIVQELAADGAFKFDVPSYRGIENPFGHLWERLDGISIEVQGTDRGGKTTAYASSTPSQFANELNKSYFRIGDLPDTEGYVKEIQPSDNGCILPFRTGASTSSYFCDYYYKNTPATGTAWRIALYGGRASAGATAGLAHFSSSATAPGASANDASRLCFYKPVLG